MARSRHILILIGALFFSCRKDPMLWEISNLNNNQVTVFGHGGMGIYGKCPLTSEPSLQEALNRGAEGVEMDVQMSLDSVLFAYHDQELSESTSCSGHIDQLNSNEINCEYKSLFDSKKIKVKSLSETLSQLQADDMALFVFDCKTPGEASEAWLNGFANALLRQIETSGYVQRCFIESTDPRFLKILRKKDPRTKLFIYLQDFEQAFTVAADQKLFGLTIDMHRITASQVEKAHKAGIRVALYNQKTEKDNIDAVEMNADFIQTDKLKHILKVFDKYKE